MHDNDKQRESEAGGSDHRLLLGTISSHSYASRAAAPSLFPPLLSSPPALSATEQNQLDLSQALGIPLNNETPAVRDPSEHPKANASTFVPPQHAVQNNAGKSRTNASNVKEIQQIGGAYGAYRN